MSKTINCEEAKQIRIVDYLSTLGIEPVQIRRDEYWYFSPFRDEKHASFKVSGKQNLWYDFGEGTGGSIIDLGIRLHQCTIPELLKKLSAGYSDFSFHQQAESGSEKENGITIQSVKELRSKLLCDYLRSRCIPIETASHFCREVEFKNGSRIYTAIGFPNRSGGYELRSPFFKGSSSPKDLTFIGNGTDTVCVFEGFIDFLSLTVLKKETGNTSFLILNSLSFTSKSLNLIKEHQKCFLFLDRDIPGQKATDKILQSAGNAVDNSAFYQNYKDINEYLQHLKTAEKQKMELAEKPRNSHRRGLRF